MPNNNTTPNTPPVRNLDQELADKKTREFEDKLIALQEEYDRWIVPKLNTSPFAILPDLMYMTGEALNKMKAGAMQSAGINPEKKGVQ